MAKPLAIDLFAGLGGWTDGLLAEGYDVIGFDIERHVYGEHRYPAQLVLQDVTTLNGSQFKGAALIVASPPCQAYSYRAMPWKRAKALPPPDNTLFEACFRIQREACAAAGRHIPMVVENVRGAQPWVGRARWNFGSFYLWGDVPALMPITVGRMKLKAEITGRPQGNFHTRSDGRPVKVPGFRFDGSGKSFQSASVEVTKQSGSGDARWDKALDERRREATAIKLRGELVEVLKGIGGKSSIRDRNCDPRPSHGNSTSRKFASAMIAKIPLTLSRHIAATWYPRDHFGGLTEMSLTPPAVGV